jgi:hypothetical protein
MHMTNGWFYYPYLWPTPVDKNYHLWPRTSVITLHDLLVFGEFEATHCY